MRAVLTGPALARTHLPPENVRERRPQVATHAGEVIARAGIDERHITGEQGWRVVNAVRNGRVRMIPKVRAGAANQIPKFDGRLGDEREAERAGQPSAAG